MFEAAAEAITKRTPNLTLPAGIELQPTTCEYVGADEVLVSMKTKTGRDLLLLAEERHAGTYDQPVGGADQQLHRPSIKGSGRALTSPRATGSLEKGPPPRRAFLCYPRRYPDADSSAS
jgi:hypothetical protein